MTHSRMNYCRAVLIGLMSVMLAGIGWAEPADTGAELKAQPIVVDADTVEYRDQEGTIHGTGQVRIEFRGVKMTADRVVVDVRTRQSQADGNVVLLYQEAQLFGEQLLYNFDDQTGVMISSREDDVELPAPQPVRVVYVNSEITTERIEFDLNHSTVFAPGPARLHDGSAAFVGERLLYKYQERTGELYQFQAAFPPWYGRADKISFLSESKALGHNGYFSTCGRAHPHYRIQAKRMYFYNDERISAHHAVVFIGPLPVLYLPWWTHHVHSAESGFSLRVGRRKTWGSFALLSWRSSLYEGVRTTVHADARELRGAAGGLDIDYQHDRLGSGSFKTYYMEDRNKHQVDLTAQERYRGQWRHRWQLNAATLAMVEYNTMSDIDFSRDFLFQEYSADSQPASDAVVTYAASTFNAGLYSRKRTNRFYTEVERLPEATLNISARELADSNVFYRAAAAAANLRQTYAGEHDGPHTNRLDLEQQLYYPTRLSDTLDWITVAPFVGTRQTFYSRDAGGQRRDFWRGIYYYGASAATMFFRFYSGPDFFLEPGQTLLRHTVKPTVDYRYTHMPTVAAGELSQFDAVDAWDKQNFFVLGLENTLQAKWRSVEDAAALETIDVLQLYPRVEYYPGGDSANRRFSPIATTADVRLSRQVALRSESVYNQYERRFDNATVDIGATAERWNIAVGKRYDRALSDQWTVDWYYAFSRPWQARAYWRYEALGDRMQQQQYTVYRDLHCWLMELTYDVSLTGQTGLAPDADPDYEHTVWIVFRLKAFPDKSGVSMSVGLERAQHRGQP